MRISPWVGLLLCEAPPPGYGQVYPADCALQGLDALDAACPVAAQDLGVVVPTSCPASCAAVFTAWWSGCSTSDLVARLGTPAAQQLGEFDALCRPAANKVPSTTTPQRSYSEERCAHMAADNIHTCDAVTTRHTDVSSVAECQALCDSTAGCEYVLWSYNYAGYCYTAARCATSGTNRNCNLAQFRATGGVAPPSAPPPPPSPPPPAPPPSGASPTTPQRSYSEERCAHMAADNIHTCDAVTTRHTDVSSVAECQALCDSTAGCEYVLWSYNYAGYCYTAARCATSGTNRNCNLAQFRATGGVAPPPAPPPPPSPPPPAPPPHPTVAGAVVVLSDARSMDLSDRQKLLQAL
eukprot:COSAG02_NODE_8078_length_2719_cov_39.390076_2_plen_351_part_01